jgi:hypothetical protein
MGSRKTRKGWTLLNDQNPSLPTRSDLKTSDKNKRKIIFFFKSLCFPEIQIHQLKDFGGVDQGFFFFLVGGFFLSFFP